MKDTIRFQQTLDKKTAEFLTEYYGLPIQQVVRTLALVEVKSIKQMEAQRNG